MRPDTLVLAAAVIALGVSAVRANELVGDWLTANGERVTIARCGRAYCTTVATGDYRGRRIAEVAGPGPRYSGWILDPRVGKTYDGSMTVDEDTLDLKGCLMEVFCRSVQTWRRP